MIFTSKSSLTHMFVYRELAGCLDVYATQHMMLTMILNPAKNEC
jgi:hypothetical protein